MSFSVLRYHSCLTSTQQVEAKCQQVREQAEEREQELSDRITSVEEERVLAENQVKDLKENIFELEDQVEQHRAVNCHTNQAVLDMESTFIQPPPQRSAHWRRFRWVSNVVLGFFFFSSGAAI